jgi:SOS-response transcriptional repressor LexA
MTTNRYPFESSVGVTQVDDDAASSLARLLGRILDASGDNRAYSDHNFVAWLEREARAQSAVSDRQGTDAVARQVAARAHARIKALGVADAVQRYSLRTRDAAVVGNIGQIARLASESNCAPWIDSLPVAAGVGREIWDEPCERWVELPAGIEHGAHVALTVSGDSMAPFLKSGDVILVDTRLQVRRDVIAVARRSDEGYVVKHVSRCTGRLLELSSLNPAYPTFTIARDPAAIIGVVVALLTREGRGS